MKVLDLPRFLKSQGTSIDRLNELILEHQDLVPSCLTYFKRCLKTKKPLRLSFDEDLEALIDAGITWVRTDEGQLFWNEVHTSLSHLITIENYTHLKIVDTHNFILPPILKD